MLTHVDFVILHVVFAIDKYLKTHVSTGTSLRGFSSSKNSLNQTSSQIHLLYEFITLLEKCELETTVDPKL